MYKTVEPQQSPNTRRVGLIREKAQWPQIGPKFKDVGIGFSPSEDATPPSIFIARIPFWKCFGYIGCLKRVDKFEFTRAHADNRPSRQIPRLGKDWW